MQTEHAVSVQIEGFEGLKKLVLVIAFVDKIHDEDHDSILDWGFFYLFELFHVYQGIQDAVCIVCLLLVLF